MPTGEFGVNDQFRNMQVNVTTLGSEFGTGTASAGAVTLAAYAGKITTNTSSAAADAAYTLTITNSKVVAADMAFVSVTLSSGTAAAYAVKDVLCGAGTLTIQIVNTHASTAWTNAVFIVSFEVRKALTAGQPG